MKMHPLHHPGLINQRSTCMTSYDKKLAKYLLTIFDIWSAQIIPVAKKLNKL